MSLNINQQFHGNVYVVTGSTQGLGAAVARLLAERGARGLILCGRNRKAGAAQEEAYGHSAVKPGLSPPISVTHKPANR